MLRKWVIRIDTDTLDNNLSTKDKKKNRKEALDAAVQF